MTDRTVPDDAALAAIPSAEISHGDTARVESTGLAYTYDETYMDRAMRSEEEGIDVFVGPDAVDAPHYVIPQSTGDSFDEMTAPQMIEPPTVGKAIETYLAATPKPKPPAAAAPLDQARTEARVAASLQEQRHLGDAALQFAIAWASEHGFALSKFTRMPTKIVTTFGPAKGMRLPDPLSIYVFSRQTNSGMYLLDLRQWKHNLTSLPLLIHVPIENDPLDAYASKVTSTAYWTAHWAKLREADIID